MVQEEELGPYKVAHRVYKYDTNGIYDNSPQSSNGGWASHTAREEESALTSRAPYLEVVATLEIVLIVIQIQLWRVLVPYFTICVRAITAYYAEIVLTRMTPSCGNLTFRMYT